MAAQNAPIPRPQNKLVDVSCSSSSSSSSFSSRCHQGVEGSGWGRSVSEEKHALDGGRGLLSSTSSFCCCSTLSVHRPLPIGSGNSCEHFLGSLVCTHQPSKLCVLLPVGRGHGCVVLQGPRGRATAATLRAHLCAVFVCGWVGVLRVSTGWVSRVGDAAAMRHDKKIGAAKKVKRTPALVF